MGDPEKPEVPEEKPKHNYTLENPPKNKDEWTQLSKDDPETYLSLTQSRTDQMYRQNKELQEQLDRERQEKINLQTQYEEERKQYQPQYTEPQAGDKKFNFKNMPQSKEDWEELNATDPVLFTDLRNHYLRQRDDDKTSFVSAQANSRKVVQVEHPDMYLPELDENNQPKKDDKGNIILKIDPYTNEPIFNPDSEKGKLWIEEYNKDNAVDNLKDGPEVLMSRMERRIKKKGVKMVEEAKTEEQKQNQVAPPGAPPPKPQKTEFSSDEEKQWAEKAVARGTYKSLEEYCQLRDTGDVGVYDENSTPTFK